MIFKKIKLLIKEFRTRDNNLARQNSELIWANIFHDTIKGKIWLKDLSLSPGRYAAGYSLLYVLTRILSDCKPGRIIEFGLGESSKIVSAFLDNELVNSSHLIIEENQNWASIFLSKFVLSKNSEIVFLPLEKGKVKGFDVYSYSKLSENINGIFDFYIIDGPTGSSNFSRYDIVLLAERIKQGNEFIILIDDCERQGEQDTTKDLLDLFSDKGINVHTCSYNGIKNVTVIASDKNKFVTTL